MGIFERIFFIRKVLVVGLGGRFGVSQGILSSVEARF